VRGRSDFAGAAFGQRANFTGAAFGDCARFDGAVFDWLATFGRAGFGYGASFTGAVFGELASFTGAAFGDSAGFDNTFFKGRVEFRGKPSAGEGIADNQPGWQHDRFLTISFANVRFDGEAIFSGRSFERTADFTNARFYYPPDFDAVTNASRIDFSGAHIGFVPPGKRQFPRFFPIGREF
jgi:hypothetical protein